MSNTQPCSHRAYRWPVLVAGRRRYCAGMRNRFGTGQATSPLAEAGSAREGDRARLTDSRGFHDGKTAGMEVGKQGRHVTRDDAGIDVRKGRGQHIGGFGLAGWLRQQVPDACADRVEMVDRSRFAGSSGRAVSSTSSASRAIRGLLPARERPGNTTNRSPNSAAPPWKHSRSGFSVTSVAGGAFEHRRLSRLNRGFRTAHPRGRR